MTVWPLFLLSMRALNSHAGPLLDEYELVELPELPQPDLATSLHDLIPFRQKREAGNQYERLERDYRERPSLSPYTGEREYQVSRGGGYLQRPPALPARKHRRKTFVFPFPFISLKFKKFAVELSEYQ